MLRGMALVGVLLVAAALGELWLSGSVSDRDWRRDVVDGECVRAEIGSVELGLIPYWRDRHFAHVPLDCEQDFSAEEPGSILVSGLVASLTLSAALIVLAIVGVGRAFWPRGAPSP